MRDPNEKLALTILKWGLPIFVSGLVSWGTWVTQTLYDVKSSLKVVMIQAHLSVADAKIEKKKELPSLADTSLAPLFNLFKKEK